MLFRLPEIVSTGPAVAGRGDAVAGLPRTEVFALIIVGLVVLAFTCAAWRAWRAERRRAQDAAMVTIRHSAGTQHDPQHEAAELVTSAV